MSNHDTSSRPSRDQHEENNEELDAIMASILQEVSGDVAPPRAHPSETATNQTDSYGYEPIDQAAFDHRAFDVSTTEYEQDVQDAMARLGDGEAGHVEKAMPAQVYETEKNERLSFWLAVIPYIFLGLAGVAMGVGMVWLFAIEGNNAAPLESDLFGQAQQILLVFVAACLVIALLLAILEQIVRGLSIRRFATILGKTALMVILGVICWIVGLVIADMIARGQITL